MPNPRPTRQFETSGGHQVVFNEYITGEEYRRIRALYGAELKKPESERDEVQTGFDADNLAFELAVVSVDGSTDGIVQRVINLPVADYREVAAEVSDITVGKKK
jgi:hypothetical protein